MEISGFVKTSLDQLKTRVEIIQTAIDIYNKKVDEAYNNELTLQTDAYNKSKILWLFKRKQLTTKEYEKYWIHKTDFWGYMTSPLYKILRRKLAVSTDVLNLIQYGNTDILLSNDSIHHLLKLEEILDIKPEPKKELLNG